MQLQLVSYACYVLARAVVIDGGPELVLLESDSGQTLWNR
jgi:hypothetical protein